MSSSSDSRINNCDSRINHLLNSKDKEVEQESPLSNDMNIEVDNEFDLKNPMIYTVSQSPPVHLLLVFALQQSLLAVSTSLSVTLVVSEAVCAQKDDDIKAKILSATFFMVGLSTFTMSTVGVRIPIFQGPALPYIIPLVAMSSIGEWSCDETVKESESRSNSTVLMSATGNDTVASSREVIEHKLAELSGTLVLVGVVHFLIGLTGTVGVIMRYVGPITIVPVIVLVGLDIYRLTVKFSETSWIVAAFTTGTGLILSLFLSNKQTPIPFWTPRKGFHIFWYPLHQVFSILIALLCGWALSAILTAAGVFSDNPRSKEYLARTDARSQIIHDTDWFIFPYPGKLCGFSFNTGAFVSFLIATFMSIIDSIGDYSACARIARVPPVPQFAFNRGIAVEGLMSMLSGAMGCCHATVSYGWNIGTIGITKVASRRVFQVAGLLYIVFAVVGKVGAVFITIPYSVLGGTQIVTMGIFVGLVLSYLQTIDLNSTRNLAIIGIALLLGLMLPYWIQQNPTAIQTGNVDINNAISMLLSNPAFTSGFFAFIMDNAVPGTLKERGLQAQLDEMQASQDSPAASTRDASELYRLPFVPNSFRRTRLAKYIPIVEYLGRPQVKTV